MSVDRPFVPFRLSSQPQPLAHVGEGLQRLLQQVMDGRKAVAVVAVSGKRNDDKRILVRSISHLLLSIRIPSDPSFDEKDSSRAFPDADYEAETDVLVWHAMQVAVQEEEVAVLVVDVVRQQQTNASICVHVVKTHISSAQQLNDCVRQMLADWDHQKAGDKDLILIRDWTMRFSDSEFTEQVMDYKSRESFHTDFRSQRFMQSFVRHMFAMSTDDEDRELVSSHRTAKDVLCVTKETGIVADMVQECMQAYDS